jgi:hypothetical protein
MDPDLRYPIGEFEIPTDITPARISSWIDDIEVLPHDLRGLVGLLNSGQLGTAYRPEGWTVAQVVHHLADSHLNSYVRFRLALTEDRPTIKPYAEAAWAELPDARGEPVGPSLDLIDALHWRWTRMLRSLGDAEWKREFDHPEAGVISLDVNLALYSWHGRHHLAHIQSLANRSGW